ncbi:hypothetical protein BGZ61DRAFT_111798 [Ilyonectria robusta]|uniref:uncharacterized protein n=1 Tax=Ilyonectria robusta TaxID=1079257 RepID=UPI001E8E6519|nr:uncharacterized protein BGZ61DRAFT_111798 [Ilyonectria robusta]KAH8669872.1 hypothetical protein BGZ61DRAFT_111798 [Ilyonectria robusta]
MIDDDPTPTLVTPPSPGAGVEEAAEMAEESRAGVFPSDSERTRDGENEAAQKISNAATKDDKPEDLQEISRKIAMSEYETWGENILAKERLSGNLKLRAQQAVLHTTFSEMRITNLENDLQILKEKVFNLPRQEKDRFPVCKPILKRSVGDEFRITHNSKKVPIGERPSIEVLYSHRVPTFGDVNMDPPKTLARRTTASHEMEEADFATSTSPERLRIRSWALIYHLRNVCRESLPSSNSIFERIDESPAVVFLRPFKLLIMYDQDIRESVKEIEAIVEQPEETEEMKKNKAAAFGNIIFEYEDLLKDLRLLIEFLDTDLKSTFNVRKSLKDGTATDIEYADLWHLFELGDLAISGFNQDQASKVVNFTGGRNPLTNRMVDEEDRTPPVDGFAVDCCSIQFDGTDYVPKLHKLSIGKFIGRRPICSLEIFPLRFLPNSSAMHNELLLQGQRYLALTSAPFCHRMLRGRTLDEPPQDLEAQVIVDMVTAVKAEPIWRPKKRIEEENLTKNDLRETMMQPFCNHNSEGCCGSDIIFKDQQMNCFANAPFLRDYGGLFSPRPATELKEDIVLLPNWAYGFVLRLRQWVTLRVSDLSEVLFENDFNQLMISEIHKQTVLALVQTHENGKTKESLPSQSIGASLDLVKGKGTGLILLLHGEPGVGKTSTAECVADKTKRPLFPITCGDIGETAMEVETKLHLNFRLAHRWGCVLLLDEADVFLAKRNKTDLRRNAVTSVFLRSLEYYAGILFLTTNRVGGIDPAFKSRIHLSVYYPRLDLDTTLKLYENLLLRAKEEQRKSGVVQFQIKNKEILSFAKRHYRGLQKEGFNTWNGRYVLASPSRNRWISN